MEYDVDKIRDVLFDEQISLALAELESGPKDIIHLAHASDMDAEVLAKRLEYAVYSGFLYCTNNVYSANTKKLEEFLSDDGQFDSVVDSITEMDSYLN